MFTDIAVYFFNYDSKVKYFSYLKMISRRKCVQTKRRSDWNRTELRRVKSTISTERNVQWQMKSREQTRGFRLWISLEHFIWTEFFKWAVNQDVTNTLPFISTFIGIWSWILSDGVYVVLTNLLFPFNQIWSVLFLYRNIN